MVRDDISSDVMSASCVVNSSVGDDVVRKLGLNGAWRARAFEGKLAAIDFRIVIGHESGGGDFAVATVVAGSDPHLYFGGTREPGDGFVTSPFSVGDPQIDRVA